MAEKKVPMRMCVACRQMREKKILVRLVRVDSNTAAIDLTGRAFGRGAYMCKNRECLERALKTKAIERALGVKLSEQERDNILGVIK